MEQAQTKKVLSVEDVHGKKYHVIVTVSDSLLAVRSKLLSKEVPPKCFHFSIGGCILSNEEEQSKLAFDYLKRTIILCPVSSMEKRAAETIPASKSATKKPRREDAAASLREAATTTQMEPISTKAKISATQDIKSLVHSPSKKPQNQGAEATNDTLGSESTDEASATPCNGRDAGEPNGTSTPNTNSKEGSRDPDTKHMDCNRGDPANQRIKEDPAANPTTVSSTDTTVTVGQEDSKLQLAQKQGVTLVEDKKPCAAISMDEKTTAPEEMTACKTSFDLHLKLQEGLTQCDTQLKKTLELLQDPQNKLFCPPLLREEWCNEIRELMKQDAPYVIIGCLGGTGVGKSSLLNALLNEADILPTSGSRGCTAAVVELRFNRDFWEPKDETTVYRGTIHFMTMEHWEAELELLLEDCCQERTQQISAQVRDENEEAATAWAKIDSVYGFGTMNSFEGNSKASVLGVLATDKRVAALLQGENGQPNTIVVEEGKVDSAKANLLLEHFTDPSKRRNKKLSREKKAWAKKFRGKINDYVYRKGNGKEPQTWPLIQKVVLRGPWTVLSTGACLVDMPGVRDANAARAKVAEQYLQNCHKIWIVAPIQRAVDDKTAKDLMGEEFKRRLLMDGQYGNIGFICTRSDDCEISETMQDHEDVARSQEGRWEQMIQRRERIAEIDKEKEELLQDKEDLATELEDLKEELKEIEAEIKEVTAESDDDMSDSERTDIEGLKESLEAKRGKADTLQTTISAWEKANNGTLQIWDNERRKTQQKLKATAAMVRNEFSTKSLQLDFQKGLEELTQSACNAEQGDSLPQLHKEGPLPEDFQLEVFCTASNEYLKLQKIKAGSDGPAACFDCPQDTQIPDVVDSVHKTTAEFCTAYTEKQISTIGDVLERIHLCATEDKADSIEGQRYRQVFDTQIEGLEEEVIQIAADFKVKMEEMVNSELEPSLERAAVKGNSIAMDIVVSWESSYRRTKHDRGRNLKRNGLHHTTYNAAVKRFGVYRSSAAGQINLDQELCDPLEKEFSAEWQRVMDTGAKKLLAETKTKLLECCTKRTILLTDTLPGAGMDSERALALATAAKRSCEIGAKDGFYKAESMLTGKQRKLNRSLLTKMAKKMAPSYSAAKNVPGGNGKFARQTTALKEKAESALINKFTPMMVQLLKAVESLKDELVVSIQKLSKVIEQRLRRVYSVCWNDQEYLDAQKDPEVKLEIRACRNRLLPHFIDVLEANKATMDFLGIAHDDVEYNVVGIETQEDRLFKSLVEAKKNNMFFDLADDSDDSEEEVEAKETPCHAKGAIKLEAGAVGRSVGLKPRQEPGVKHPVASSSFPRPHPTAAVPRQGVAPPDWQQNTSTSSSTTQYRPSVPQRAVPYLQQPGYQWCANRAVYQPSLPYVPQLMDGRSSSAPPRRHPLSWQTPQSASERVSSRANQSAATDGDSAMAEGAGRKADFPFLSDNNAPRGKRRKKGGL